VTAVIVISILVATVVAFVAVLYFLRPAKLRYLVYQFPGPDSITAGEPGFTPSAPQPETAADSGPVGTDLVPYQADLVPYQVVWHPSAICLNTGERQQECWCPQCGKARRQNGYS
jgi:hypothetical protein